MPSGVAAAQRLSGRLPETSVGLAGSQIKAAARRPALFLLVPVGRVFVARPRQRDRLSV